jgi:hypothetical protein
MNLRRLVQMSLVLIPAMLHSQELSDFYSVQGFNSPTLRTGQYILSFSPHYFHNPFSTSSRATLTQNNVQGNQAENNPSGYAYLNFATSGIYGISDQVTITLAVTFSPNQDMLDHNYKYSFTAPSYVQNINEVYTDSHDHINGSLTLSYRPQANLELSFLGRYFDMHTPSNYHGSYYLNNNGTVVSTNGKGAINNDNTGYDLSLSIVLLGK